MKQISCFQFLPKKTKNIQNVVYKSSSMHAFISDGKERTLKLCMRRRPNFAPIPETFLRYANILDFGVGLSARGKVK